MRKFDRYKIIQNTPNDLPLPSEFIDPDVPLVLEIGAGTGMHPINFSKSHPEMRMIAIEKTSERFGKFKRQYDKFPQPNLLPVHAHAVSWVAHNLEENSVDQIFVLYPNPNPKKQDLNKRWHAMPFFGYLIDLLKPNGKIVIRTNEKFYAEEAQCFMSGQWGLFTKSFEFLDSDVSEYKTLFEKKYLERGQTCYEIMGQKTI